eukprot:2570998-Pleurochrysis_carterae.AAC.5
MQLVQFTAQRALARTLAAGQEADDEIGLSRVGAAEESLEQLTGLCRCSRQTSGSVQRGTSNCTLVDKKDHKAFAERRQVESMSTVSKRNRHGRLSALLC